MVLFMIGVALLFLGLTLATFNRAMGRMPDKPRRASAAAEASSDQEAPQSRDRVTRARYGGAQYLISRQKSRTVRS